MIPFRHWLNSLLVAALMAGSRAVAAPQAEGLQAAFRSGQTFVIWKEVAAPGVHYRVYRTTAPIEHSEQLTPEALIATVDDQTSLNLMASINRMELSRTPRDRLYHIARRNYFVIADGCAPLADDQGLFVHTARADETAWYAVTAVIGGEENRELGGNVSSSGVRERVEPVSAVAQNGEGDFAHWIDSVGTPLYPAMGSHAGVAYNFRVHAPKGTGPYALIGVLHGALFQYNTPDSDRYAKLDGEEGDKAVRVALDAPLMSGKIEGIEPEPGESPGEGRGRRRGGTPGGWAGHEARVLWTMDWVAAHYPVDRDRYALRGESMGGIGSIAIVLGHPEKFAAFNAYVPMFGTEAGDERSRELIATSAYDRLRLNPKQDWPFIVFTAGKADHVVKWLDKPEFATFAQRQQVGMIFYWDAREHAYGNTKVYRPVWGEPNGRPTIDLTRFSLRRSYPALANLSVDDDIGTNNPLAVPAKQRGPLDAPGIGDLTGTINGQVDWDDASIIDEPSRYEITLRLLPFARAETATADVTPRRMQRFNPQSGSSYAFSVTGAGGRMLASGRVKADENGHLQVKGVPITRTGITLRITE